MSESKPVGAVAGGMVLGIASALAIGVATAKPRVDQFDVDGVRVQSVQIAPKPDGGCFFAACGSLTSVDGYVSMQECAPLQDLHDDPACARVIGVAHSLLSKTFRVAE